VVFACNWCSYTAADLAGTTRLQMPAGFTVLRVMCSGRVDPLFILQAFALGADAVLVTGCHPGDCHYTSGNLHARRRVDFLKQVLDHLGLSGRLEMHYISAAEATRFQQLLTAAVERIARLGPSPLHAARPELTPHKRDAIRTILQHFARQLSAAIPEGAVIPEEVVVEDFGDPEYDLDRCIGCGACAASCPQHNIEVTDAEGTRVISQFHSRCVRCKTCEQICPVDALRVMPRFDLAAFLSDEPKAAVELQLVPCSRCGKPVAPLRQLDHLAGTVEGHAAPRQEAAICAACQRQHHAAKMRQHLSANT
jgi:coenzyme F420-reducing hydrogenase delta subunit/formate hydrogenlyase subunit 6/NADH:ubiquinone oxidoreductase subunit I